MQVRGLLDFASECVAAAKVVHGGLVSTSSKAELEFALEQQEQPVLHWQIFKTRGGTACLRGDIRMFGVLHHHALLGAQLLQDRAF